MVEQRTEYLELLDSNQLAPRELVEKLGDSRATVYRVLNRLQETGLVKRTCGGYVTTPFVSSLLERHRRYLSAMQDIVDAEEAVRPLPGTAAVSADMLVGAECHDAGRALSGQIYDRVEPVFEANGPVRALLPPLGTSRLLDLLHATVLAEDATVELLLSEGLLNAMTDEHADIFYDFLYRASCTLFVGETPPYVLLCGDERAAVVVLTDNNTAHSAIVNDSDRAVEWAHETFREYHERSVAGEDLARQVGSTRSSERRMQEIASVFSDSAGDGTAD